MMTCPNPAPTFGNYPTGALFSATYTAPNVTPPQPSHAYPSYPNPTQGECLPDCPFVAAIGSIAWVNRRFILNNFSGASPLSGNYTTYFWDYPALTPPYNVPTGLNEPLQLNPATGQVKTKVVVAGTIPLDSNLKPVDPTSGGSYGAGSLYDSANCCANEYWPSLYEKAYAKFCLYKLGANIAANNNQPLTVSNLADATKDPSFAEVQSLTQVNWGGNAGIGLMYLTPQNCWQYNLQSSSFVGGGGVTCTATPNIFTYIKNAFCSQTASVAGLNKTQFPLVAWTYPSETASPAGLYDQNTNLNGILYTNIVAGHCYPILGVYSSANGNYIVLRTTYGIQEPGSNPPTPNYPALALSPSPKSCSFYDALFKIGTFIPTYYPPTVAVPPNNVSINLTNGVFGIDGSAIVGKTGLTMFQNYFQSIAWTQC